MDLSVREWEVVGEAPAVVFVLVASSDRRISEAEWAVFSEQWLPKFRAFSFSSDAHADKVYRWSVDEGWDRIDTLREQGVHELTGRLKRARTILDRKADTGSADRMAEALLKLAQDVAEASGGFLGMGDKVDGEEKKRIQRIRRALREQPVI